jgi:uncharacterized protein (DUF927 family)
MFESLHGIDDGAVFSKVIVQAASKYYGTAWIAFLKRLAAEDRGEISKIVHTGVDTFRQTFLTSEASGQAKRVADRFALVGAAGELATDWGITGWPAGAALKAAGACFKAWLANRGGEGKQEDRAMLAAVRTFLRIHGEARFTDIDRSNITDNHAPAKMNRAGWREKSSATDGDTEYYISSEAFRTDVCKGFDHSAVGRLLIAKGYAETGTENIRSWLIKKKIEGEGRPRVVHILPALFEAEND